jgi:hypothetical protein
MLLSVSLSLDFSSELLSEFETSSVAEDESLLESAFFSLPSSLSEPSSSSFFIFFVVAYYWLISCGVPLHVTVAQVRTCGVKFTFTVFKSIQSTLIHIGEKDEAVKSWTRKRYNTN